MVLGDVMPVSSLVYSCICHFTAAVYSDGDQEQISSIPKLVYDISVAVQYKIHGM